MIHKHRGNRRLVTAKKAHHKLDILKQYWGFSSKIAPSYGALDKAKVNSCGVINVKKQKNKTSNSKKYKSCAELKADDKFAHQLNMISDDEAISA